MAALAIKRAPIPSITDMKTFTEEITPAQAKEFLARNSTNRRLRPSWVKELAGRMERGEWTVTHQGIALTPDLRLLDGQHRMHAIIATGLTIPMQVSYDCDPRTYEVIDGGIKRTAADHLSIPPMMAAVAKLLWVLPAPTLRKTCSSQQISSVLSWARPVIEEVSELAGGKSTRTSSVVQMPIVVHLMAGRREVLPKFVAFKNMALEDIPPSIGTLLKQMMDGGGSRRLAQWDASCRVWRAFNPEQWEMKVLALKGTGAAMGEMAHVVEAYRRQKTGAAT